MERWLLAVSIDELVSEGAAFGGGGRFLSTRDNKRICEDTGNGIKSMRTVSLSICLALIQLSFSCAVARGSGDSRCGCLTFCGIWSPPTLGDLLRLLASEKRWKYPIKVD